MALPTRRAMKVQKGKKSSKAITAKAKRVTKIARGRFARALVLRGTKEKTVGGLTKDALMRNRRGKIVSKKASANGKRRYKNIEGWVESVMEARKALRVEGFVAINGKSLQGKALYVKSKALCATRGSARSASLAASTAAPPAAMMAA